MGLDNAGAKRDKRNKEIFEFTSLRRQKRHQNVHAVIVCPISSFLRPLYSFVAPSFLQAIIWKIGAGKEEIWGGSRVKLRDLVKYRKIK